MRERGMAQKLLAERAQMTQDAMSRALRGQRGFAAIELADIALALDEDVYFLITGNRDPSRLSFAARHSFDRETKSRSVDGLEQDEQILSKVQTAYNLAGDFDATPRLPEGPTGMRHALGAEFVERFSEGLEGLGVDVIVLPELSTAYSFTVNGRNIIAINGSGNWFNENWSIAHELAHHALGHENVRPGSGNVDSAESAANSFAAELLLPETEMRAMDWASMPCRDVAEFLWCSGVSTSVLTTRLKALRLVPSQEVAGVLNLTTQGALRKHWTDNGHDQGPDRITDRMEKASRRSFPTWLRSAHLQRIELGKLAKGLLAWMLGTNEEELEIPSPAPVTPLEGDELLALLD